MADLGDIIVHYGQETGFQRICPLDVQQKAASELNSFFATFIPRSCMGYTLNFAQISQLLDDIYIAEFFTKS